MLTHRAKPLSPAIFATVLLFSCLIALPLRAQDCSGTLVEAIQSLNGTTIPPGTTVVVCGTSEAVPTGRTRSIVISAQNDPPSLLIELSGTGSSNTVTEGSQVTITVTSLSDGPLASRTISLQDRVGRNPVSTPVAGGAAAIIGGNAFLPVTYASFNGRSIGKGVRLDWETATESGNEGFELQRSPDGQRWQTLEFIPNAKGGDAGAAYDFTDRDPIPGLAYYRLKQMDFDGSFEYSPVVSVRFGVDEELFVFPNPVGEFLNVRFAGEETGGYRIVGSGGRLIASGVLAPNASLDVSNLRRGVYTLLLEGGRGSKRFLKN